MTVLGKELYVFRILDQIECHDMQLYSTEKQSLVFHHVRTVTMSGVSTPELPAVMVGHSAARRLFMLDSVDIWQDIKSTCRGYMEKRDFLVEEVWSTVSREDWTSAKSVAYIALIRELNVYKNTQIQPDYWDYIGLDSGCRDCNHCV